jgi:hypothetical protein
MTGLSRLSFSEVLIHSSFFVRQGYLKTRNILEAVCFVCTAQAWFLSERVVSIIVARIARETFDVIARQMIGAQEEKFGFAKYRFSGSVERSILNSLVLGRDPDVVWTSSALVKRSSHFRGL